MDTDNNVLIVGRRGKGVVEVEDGMVEDGRRLSDGKQNKKKEYTF